VEEVEVVGGMLVASEVEDVVSVVVGAVEEDGGDEVGNATSAKTSPTVARATRPAATSLRSNSFRS
jgi:hypothetical protein